MTDTEAKELLIGGISVSSVALHPVESTFCCGFDCFRAPHFSIS